MSHENKSLTNKRLTIHFRESFAHQRLAASLSLGDRFTWKRKRNRWIECPSPHGAWHAAIRTPWWKGSTQISVFRAYTGWPERSRTALSIGSRAVPQFIDCRRAVHQSTPPCTPVSAFETSRSALYPFTHSTPPPPRSVSASDKIHRIKWHVNTSYGLFSMMRSIFRVVTWTYRAL